MNQSLFPKIIFRNSNEYNRIKSLSQNFPFHSCSMATGRPQCVCRKGFEGIPYSECHDVDECLNPVCGPNAQCINTLGGYDCQCRFGFVGNPFEGCTPSSPPSGQTEREDLCRDTQCGPNAICNAGQCLCAPGFKVGIENV